MVIPLHSICDFALSIAATCSPAASNVQPRQRIRYLPRKAAEQACLDCDRHLLIAGEPVYQRDVDRSGEMTSWANGPALTATTMYRCTVGSIDTRVPNNESGQNPAYANTFV
jgi:hypothetical protein